MRFSWQTRSHRTFAYLILLAPALAIVLSQYEIHADEPKVKLAKLPAISLGSRKPVSKEKAAQIKACIDDLADIDSADACLANTMSGEVFLPLLDHQKQSAETLVGRPRKSSATLRTLVQLGPDALPFLLDALGDERPTRIKIEHRASFGGMFLAHELWGNPANALEMRVIGRQSNLEDAMKKEQRIYSYTLKVGDVCLVGIGQIVGRGYKSVRYQPTNCIVINSPTEDGRLREQVRRIWQSDDPARKLLDALLLDYATEGITHENDLGDWDIASQLQIEAAKRLLYYYPKETSPMIGARLRKLDVHKPRDRRLNPEKDVATLLHREVANGVRTVDFLTSVSWCQEPTIRDAIQVILSKTDDIDISHAVRLGKKQ